MATITPVVGSIGQKTDRNNLLTYALTGTMSTITEKANGAVIGTKTATSGQSLTVALTQAQWDDVAFGKYSAFRNLLPMNDNVRYNEIGSGANNNAWVNNELLVYNGSAEYLGKGIKIDVVPNQPLTISYTRTNATDGVIPRIILGYSATTSEITSSVPAGSYTFTPTQSTIYFRFLRDGVSSASIPAKFKDLMLTTGSTVKPFVPFGGNNILTIEMGTETFTYTFDKRLAVDADLLSAVKATKDANEVFLPAVKSKLATNLTSKGQSSVGTETLDALINKVPLISTGKKYASGQAPSSDTTGMTVTGLNFVPSIIIWFNTSIAGIWTSKAGFSTVNYLSMGSLDSLNSSAFKSKGTASVTGTGFTVLTGYNSTGLDWIAIE